jgi:acetylornithine/N-succinyldiaminopimelate aminotransferase
MNIIQEYPEYFLNTYNRYPLVLVKGEGMWLYTDSGKKILDMSSGIATSALGHADAELAEAVKSQVMNIVHTSSLYYNPVALQMAKALLQDTVFSKVFFCNSGAEANEGAIKIARKYGKQNGSDNKYKIITMKNSFHGRTVTTLSATGQTKYQKGFEPMTPGFVHVELNNPEELLSEMDTDVCAIIVEVVQGEGGIRPVKKEFLSLARELCDKFKALLIYDEIQTGVGRTGKMYAYEHFLPVKPDIITLAKGIAGGFPLGAILVADKAENVLSPGEHASTFGGNLISCTAGLIVFNRLRNSGLLEKVNSNGEYFRQKALKLKDKYKLITDVRGLGYLNGIELSVPARDIILKLIENGVLTVPSGENVVRFIPPLIAEKEHLDYALEQFEKVMAERN